MRLWSTALEDFLSLRFWKRSDGSMMSRSAKKAWICSFSMEEQVWPPKRTLLRRRLRRRRLGCEPFHGQPPRQPTRVEASPAAAPGTEDITESVIRIIMDATGYEHDEIEPEMDLREDLSIRSSRFP